MAEEGPLRLRGAVRHYEWGGYELIASLTGASNPGRRPFAELWLGAHRSAPALVETASGALPLEEFIAARPAEILGPAAAARYGGRLPYLLKVLEAQKMLSIQAHPSRRQAEEGFLRENRAGVAPGAPERNYKDPNHKPEVHVALTEFWMLHGFRPLEEIARTLREAPELASVMPDFGARLPSCGAAPTPRRDLLRELYTRVMTMPQEDVNRILDPLIARLERGAPPARNTPHFWMLRAAREFPRPGGGRDRGLFSIYLLNLVRLAPGEGTYQPAGVLHAYLEGANVELMASSDNVLRGGLTPKHIDVDELLRTVSFESGAAEVLKGCAVSPSETVYRTPAAEFELSRIDLVPGRVHRGAAVEGPDTVLLLEGTALLDAGGRRLSLQRGNAVFVPHGRAYSLAAETGCALLFKASLPASPASPR